MRINKKTWLGQFEAVLSGKKKFDMRLNDFDIKEGDTLILEVRQLAEGSKDKRIYRLEY